MKNEAVLSGCTQSSNKILVNKKNALPFMGKYIFMSLKRMV